MSRRWAGRPCSPGSPSRQQRRADPGKRLQGARSPGDHRVDQSSEVVSRYLSLAWASGAASRRLSCVVSALGYEAGGHHALSASTEMSAALGGQNVANSDMCAGPDKGPEGIASHEVR